MGKLSVFFNPPEGTPRTVEEIRAKHQMHNRILKALEQQWTLSRIMAKYRVKPDYVRAIAEMHGLTVERPSDNWVGRV